MTIKNDKGEPLFVGYIAAVDDKGRYLYSACATYAKNATEAERAIKDAIAQKLVHDCGFDRKSIRLSVMVREPMAQTTFYGVIGAVRYRALYSHFVEFSYEDVNEVLEEADKTAVRIFPKSDWYQKHNFHIVSLGQTISDLIIGDVAVGDLDHA